MAGEKIPNWECLFVHHEKGLFLSVYLDAIKMAGKKQNLDPMCKLLNKEVDLGEPTSFLENVYLGCTQRQCEISKGIVDNCRTMFESRISAGGVEKSPFPQNLRFSSCSYDMAGHAPKCVERYCVLANRTTQLSVDRLWSVPPVRLLPGPTAGTEKPAPPPKRRGDTTHAFTLWCADEKNLQIQASQRNPESSE